MGSVEVAHQLSGICRINLMAARTCYTAASSVWFYPHLPNTGAQRGADELARTWITDSLRWITH
jgi:hypothetical protein